MSNLSNTSQQRRSKAEQHEASKFTLGVVMAGVFAFFVAGIASAFIYGKDTNPTRSAQAAAPPTVSARPKPPVRAAVPNNAAVFANFLDFKAATCAR